MTAVWKPIAEAPHDVGREILGVIRRGSVVIKEPFISFWSPTMGRFYCSPTHYIDMPEWHAQQEDEA